MVELAHTPDRQAHTNRDRDDQPEAVEEVPERSRERGHERREIENGSRSCKDSPPPTGSDEPHDDPRKEADREARDSRGHEASLTTSDTR